MISEFEKIAWQTEYALFGGLKAQDSQIPMWLDLEDRIDSSSVLQLKEMTSPNDWESYKNLRTEIEIPFGITSSEQIDKILEEIHQLISKFPATWYLAFNSLNQIVGSIGLVEFEDSKTRIGRLLDVDIAPRHQGRGYGNQLIGAVIQTAQVKKLSALCLKTDADRWVKDWYSKLGFKKIGYWNPKDRSKRLS